MGEKANYLRTGHHYVNVMAPIIFLLVVLFFSAWIRFDGITKQGVMTPADCFLYQKEAKLWATGQPPRFLTGGFYRPVSYFLQGMAIQVFGDNDYSIKLLHGIMDLISICLIFIIASIFTRDYWVGAASSLVYAFLPVIVRLVRSEMVQVESTFFALWSFFFFILFVAGKTRNSVRFFLLFMSGFSLGLAANTHADLAFIAPGYVLYLFIKSYNSQNKRESLKEFFIFAFIFTFSFFTPYLLGLFLFGPQKVLQVFFREMSIAKHVQIAHLGHASEPTIFFNILYYSIKHFFGKQTLLIAILLIGTIFIMIYRKMKKESDPLWAYSPLILIFSYAFFHSCFLYTIPQGRLLMPLLPLVIFILTQWYYKIFKQLFGKYYLIVFICLFSMLFLLNPKVIPGKTKYKSQIRLICDILKDDVNSKNKLLIAPVIIGQHLGFGSELYFGKNAVYLYNLPIKKEYNLNSLKELLKDRNIRYIFLGKQTHHLYKKFLEPHFPLPIYSRFHRWFRNKKIHYSLEKDLKIIHAYIQSKGGLLINKNRFGKIYYLTEKPVQKEPGLITNGSFEHWWKGFLIGGWQLREGKISKSGEATHGLHSLRVEPAGKKGAGITWVFENPMHLLEAGSKLRVRLDAKANKSDKLIFFFTAKIKGKRKNVIPCAVRYTGKGEWMTLTKDFEIPTGLRRLAFHILLRSGARESAFVDNLSIIVKD
jgi:hypothetical protein